MPVPEYVVDAGPRPALPVAGTTDLFPVRRVYCVGRNYADHVREMGGDERQKPFFFQKPGDAIVPEGGRVPYPPLTQNLQHEIEYVLAVGKEGFEVTAQQASALVFGVGLGIDLTRRDLQFEARDAGRPWEVGKAFDQSAPCSAVKPLNGASLPKSGRIMLAVNGTTKQDGDLTQMIWNADEVIAQLSHGYRLMPGDLIFTGTPAGVSTLKRGDIIEASLQGIADLKVEIV